MKKIMILLVLFVVGMTSNAQSAKKEPPPPKDEVVKSEPQKIKASEPLDDDFYKRNPSVSNFSRQGNIITLKKKDGKIERYDMSKEEEDISFTEKYGVSSIPPPPPPKVVKSRA